jgi:hypothetical protein
MPIKTQINMKEASIVPRQQDHISPEIVALAAIGDVVVVVLALAGDNVVSLRLLIIFLDKLSFLDDVEELSDQSDNTNIKECNKLVVRRVFDISNKEYAGYILMMVNIKESDSTITVTLDIPGGKRRLGESTLKGAVRKMYEETFVPIRKEDLELIYGTETDKIYRVVV